ncbi:hypothetical protein EHZ13_01920 [Clostridium perfringens]|uniref:hypothetical protein n=2 Tax=Clostridium perfringens TaxID=1502 RepID=UPI000F51DD95|nr:hypothetical protein [Clostridium perfringens]WEV14815.1 hypothetical protein PL325_08695 [Clostridium perfringens D]MBI6014502.1 hypothetical protein [Clostridium perfringens]MDK0638079.1 hypothetical protein [Clostridium perfringens]MDK0698842.1 hypothetical protein [Clostridium perfringens]MDM0762011.1 hypothetical protein [Clostridium perfringens]
MGRKNNFEEFTDSQDAIRQYMRSKEGNNFMHKARVVVYSNGETMYNSILKVIPSIETNNSVFDIIGDEEFERYYYTKYNNEYQKFKFINDILSINGNDRNGNFIEIDIISI